MSKKVVVRTTLALVCGLVISFAGHILISASEDGRQPQVITKKTSLHDSAGVEMMQNIETIAYRRDGSVARFSRRIHIESGMQAEFADIIDVRAGTRTFVEYSTHSISTSKLPEGIAARLAIKPNCGSLERAKGKEIGEFLGYEAVRDTFEDEKSRIERWVSPELDCLVMREVQTQIKPDGREGARNVVEVVSVDIGQPLNHLFQIPAGFTERAPSEIVAARALLDQEMAGIEGPVVSTGVPEKNLRRADTRYELNKPSKPGSEEKKQPPQ